MTRIELEIMTGRLKSLKYLIERIMKKSDVPEWQYVLLNELLKKTKELLEYLNLCFK
jgi:hypothetical protein